MVESLKHTINLYNIMNVLGSLLSIDKYFLLYPLVFLHKQEYISIWTSWPVDQKAHTIVDEEKAAWNKNTSKHDSDQGEEQMGIVQISSMPYLSLLTFCTTSSKPGVMWIYSFHKTSTHVTGIEPLPLNLSSYTLKVEFTLVIIDVLA